MNLINWNHVYPSKSIFGELVNDLFNDGFTDFRQKRFNNNSPSVNIIEESNEFILEFAAPGLEKEDFKVEVDGDYLEISANKNEEKEEKKSEGFTKREFNYSRFTRRFYLPETIDTSKIEGNYNDGILKIKIAKKEEAIKDERREINIS